MSEWLALSTLVLAPLPFGSVDTVWICAWCVALGLSLACADLSLAHGRQLVWLVPVLLAFAGIVSVVVLQQQPAIEGLTNIRFWQAAAAFAPDVVPRNAATLDPPWRALGPSLLFTLTFIRFFLLGASREKADRFLWVAATAAAAYACFSIASAVIDPGLLLWRAKRAYVGSLTGTFVNRNTAATYFGCASVLWLLLALRGVRRVFGSFGSPVDLAREMFLAGVPLRLLPPQLAFGLCFAATLMTASRAGVMLTVAVLPIAASLWAGAVPIRKWIVTACVLAMIIGAFFQVWGGLVTSRFESRGLIDLNRAAAYTDVLGMIRDFPWLGIGLGQFEIVFPAYRDNTGPVPGVWDKAHSVPLELAAEVGLPAAGVVGLAWLITAIGVLWGLRRVSAGRIFPIAALSVGLIGTGHSLVDFSLQIPGYAVTFAAVTAVGLAQSVRRIKSRDAGRLARSSVEDRGGKIAAMDDPRFLDRPV